MEHHTYRLWDIMKCKPICTCSSYAEHQQLNYNCCFRRKHNHEQETTLKIWGTALSWTCTKVSSVSPPLPPSDLPALGEWEKNTTKHHYMWMRFSMFALQSTVETSGRILFSTDVLMYFGRSVLCALYTLLLASMGSIILDTAPVPVLW